MDYQLIRAYCAKDLNGKLRPRDKSFPITPESRFEELLLLDEKHRRGAENLNPRQYAAAVLLRAIELMGIPYQPDDECPEFTESDSVETGRLILADALHAYLPHLSESEAAPLLPMKAELEQFKLSVTPQQAGTKPPAAPAKPLQRTVAQGLDILAAIRQSGHDPLALPINKPGKPGVKSATREALKDSALFVGVKVFDKAWQHLRDAGDIADKA